nr:hypothetical protein [Tanacetum cinerariifolium]
MSFSKRSDSDAVCYTKPLDSLTGMTTTSGSTLLLIWLPFCGIPRWTCLLSFMLRINVRIVERERAEGEEKLMDSTVGRVVSLLPVAPTRAESELEACVDKLFDEGGSTEQGISLSVAVMMLRLDWSRLLRILLLRITSNGPATGGKSPFVLKELLASSILNVEVGVEAVAIMPLITSSISAMSEHEDDNPTDSITGHNLRTIGPFERFVISSDSSHHSSTNAYGAEVDSIIRFVVLPTVMTEAVVTSHVVSAPSILVPKMGTEITPSVHASMFHDSDSTKTVRADAASLSYSAKQDLSMGSRELNTETLHQIFVPQ